MVTAETAVVLPTVDFQFRGPTPLPGAGADQPAPLHGSLHTGVVTDALPLDETSPVRPERFPYRGQIDGLDDPRSRRPRGIAGR